MMQLNFQTIIGQVNNSLRIAEPNHKYQIIKTLCELALNWNLYVPNDNTCRHLRLRGCSAIDIDQSGLTIVIKKVIGEGSYKKAKLGFDVLTESICVHTTARYESDFVKTTSLKEIQIQKLFAGNEAIVQLLRNCEYPAKDGVRKMAVTMEYGDKGDLYNVLFVSKIFYDIKMNELLTLVRDLFKILVALEEQRVLHRDIKLENIYIKTVDGSPRFMLGDFGLASTIEDARMALIDGEEGIGGTILYAPPEIILSSELDHLITPKNDVWSMGVVLFAILRLDLPSVSDTQNFDQDVINAEIDRIKNTDSQTIKCLSEDPKTLAFLLDLVKQMLSIDLDKRATGKALLQQLESYITFT